MIASLLPARATGTVLASLSLPLLLSSGSARASLRPAFCHGRRAAENHCARDQ